MRTRARAATLTGALLLFALAACGKKKDDTAVAVDTTSAGTMTVAVDTAPIRVSDIQVGKSVGADKKVADQTTDFGVRDTMYVAVITDGAAKDAKLSTKWTFNGKQTVKEDTQTISPTGGTTVTEFHVDKKTAWPKGKYKIEVMLNGVSAGTKDLEVK
ncbi:MAG TPA: hypothetical protein VGN73_02395 [Gemmatimonadaceae bacterium]|jgi:hypothetical protein|nr:hypothetical protein [Gemmatimonadaceae bacterium]